MTNKSELLEDGQLLYRMRNNGMSDDAVRETIESVRAFPYSDFQWGEIQYHADMISIHETEKYSGFDLEFDILDI